MENKLIYQQIAAAMEDIDAIGKNNKNQQQGFLFRGIDDVYNSLHLILSRHKLFTVINVIEDRTEERQSKNGNNLIYRVLKIKYTVYTSDGSFVDGVVIGEGMDSGDKAANKAMAIAHKYFLTQLFCIPTKDVIDPDKESHEVMSKKEKEKETEVEDFLSKTLIQIDEQDSMEEVEKICKKFKEKYGTDTLRLQKVVASYKKRQQELASKNEDIPQ